MRITLASVAIALSIVAACSSSSDDPDPTPTPAADAGVDATDSSAPTCIHAGQPCGDLPCCGGACATVGMTFDDGGQTSSSTCR